MTKTPVAQPRCPTCNEPTAQEQLDKNFGVCSWCRHGIAQMSYGYRPSRDDFSRWLEELWLDDSSLRVRARNITAKFWWNE